MAQAILALGPGGAESSQARQNLICIGPEMFTRTETARAYTFSINITTTSTGCFAFCGSALAVMSFLAVNMPGQSPIMAQTFVPFKAPSPLGENTHTHTFATTTMAKTPARNNPWRDSELSKRYPRGCLDEPSMTDGYYCNEEIVSAWKQTGLVLANNPACYPGQEKKQKMLCQVFGNKLFQIPRESTPYAVKLGTGDYKVLWTQNHTDTLLKLALHREDFSPEAYPFCVPDLYEAFDLFSVRGLRVMVGGSVSPWVEAVLAASGAQQVSTLDYSPREFHTNMTELVLHGELAGKAEVFDAIVSYSSIEHDGIGRYGDPINPEGDRAAMFDFKQWLKPSGLLYLGIPVDPSGPARREGTGHRIYDQKRLDSITDGFRLLKVIDTHYGFHLKEPPRAWWKNQPIFVLQKP
mmetsp:Transcript_103817/g.221975  ORF Transcript_103817/g.221975 Transcript_103817/m.221975 type:complete len:409 (+) Transcript_103817:13-1239(+)